MTQYELRYNLSIAGNSYVDPQEHAIGEIFIEDSIRVY